MTVKDLKEKLNEFPDNMDVFVDTFGFQIDLEDKSGRYQLVDLVNQVYIPFYDNNVLRAWDNAIIIEVV